MDEPPADPPLRLTVCPRCEYSLAAHPPAGVCPECGRAYDTDEIVLYGYATGGKRNVRNAKPDSARSLILSGIAVLVIIVWFGRTMDRMPFAIYVSIIVYMFGAQLWRRYGDHGAGLVQVRLTPQGFRQGQRQLGPLPFERNDRRRLRPWRRDLEVRVTPHEPGRAQIEIMPEQRWWKLAREYVNADVALDGQHVATLSARLHNWLMAAPR